LQGLLQERPDDRVGPSQRCGLVGWRCRPSVRNRSTGEHRRSRGVDPVRAYCALVKRMVVALVVSALAVSACSSGHVSPSASNNGAFCAAARRVKNDNARGTATMSAAEQRKLSESQFNAVMPPPLPMSAPAGTTPGSRLPVPQLLVSTPSCAGTADSPSTSSGDR